MPQDPLIDYNLENFLLLFSILLFTIVILIFGFISRDLENAIFFTIVASACIILVFLVTYF